MIILILGKPGSGKGTQAKMLAKKFGLYYFSTGDFSRQLAKKNPRIDKLISKKGQLIPEKEMTSYVSELLNDRFKGKPKDLIFEGYPRFVTQYKFLGKWLKDRNVRIDFVFLLDIGDKEVVKRLSARRKDPKTGRIYNLKTSPKPGPGVDVKSLIQRKDDKPEVIEERLEEYERNTLPMVKLIESEGVLARVDGERPIDVIQKDLVSLVEERLRDK